MAPVVRQIYDQMLEPKWVIAMGACASAAGMFNNYAIVQGVDQIIPVDIYLPGCPPTPDALLDGLMKLQLLVKMDPHHRAALGMDHGTVPYPSLVPGGQKA
jgi:NADH-quinone oxidoreductase subunit B